ncbi:MAG: SGNH/GDSL hydrolase family protein [Bacteroidales bacterium]|nr:SGNH/GDSL hydrolase family protein [Bacteroidales bacterium]
MKRILILLAALMAVLPAGAQGFKFVEATNLTIVGKVFPNTPDPYKRMDYTKYTGWVEKDINLLNTSAGIITVFRTDAPTIKMRAMVESGRPNTRGERGFDLYIKKDGKWTWAGSAAIPAGNNEYKECKLVDNMAPGVKECLVYFPLFSVVTSAQVGVPEGCMLEPGEKPFKYNIVLYGSSFTHGSCSVRAGNTIPGFLTRMTGFQFNSLGVSGDAKMQPQFLNALKDAEADAFFFDTFSNPSPKEIRERTLGFIEGIQSTHPGVPLIFIRSIYRENRNFDTVKDKNEAEKMAVADSIMAVAVKRYKDVYYIKSSNAASPDHETTTDGIHPSDFGYHIWAESVRKPLVKILKKYGIK